MEFALEVQRASDVIAESPRTWPRWPGSTHKPHIRRFVVSRFPFALAFVIKRDHVVVLAVAHTSRDPFYWLDRLRT